MKKIKSSPAQPDPDTTTMIPEDLCHRIFWLTREVMTFWKDGGWASGEAAALLQKSMLLRQVSLAQSLRQWINSTSEGDLVLAWANLGALVEGQLKLALCVYYLTYQQDADAMRNRKTGELIDPDGSMLEPLRQFFEKKWWMAHDNWNDYIALVMQRRNAIHAFEARTIGTFSEWKAQLPSHLSFMRAINGRLPYPPYSDDYPAPPRDEKDYPVSKLW